MSLGLVSWKQGTLSQTGIESGVNNRVFSHYYYRSLNINEFWVNEEYSVSLRYYDDAFNGIDLPVSWISGNVQINKAYPYFRIVARYADDREINITEFSKEKVFDNSIKGTVTSLQEMDNIMLGLVNIPMSLGSISAYDGTEIDANNRVRSKLLPNSKIKLESNLKISCRYYDSKGNFSYSEQSWTEGEIYTPNPDYPLIRVVVAKVDDSEITNANDIHVSVYPLSNRVYDLENEEDSVSIVSLTPKTLQIKSESLGIVKSYSLKSIKQSNAVRGRSPIPVAWLYIDNDTDDMYLVKGSPYGQLKHIGKWNRTITWNGEAGSDFYTIFITPEDDLICVFRSERLNTGIPRVDTDRKNPIIYKHGDYSNPKVVEFDSGTAPSAWLMSSGADYDYINNFFCFSEYGRVNLTNSQVWKVLPPYDSKELWSVSQSWPTSGLPDAGFKHCHCCEIDPYTGVIYVATGDDDTAAMIYASKDGTSYVKVAGPNEKMCRLLNFIFTKDYIWWASDSHAMRHALFRATRGSDGLISDDTIELLTQIPYSENAWAQATYITYYAEDKNILLFLDYYDANGFAEPMQIYGYDINSNRIIKLKTLNGVTDGVHKIGFRCECSSFYQGLFNRGITLGWQWAINENLLLNNTLDNQLGNVELIVE